MNKLSKRLLTITALLAGWFLLIGMQWTGEHSIFNALITLPVIMLLMGTLAALTECEVN